jgi:hypothetical protein
MGKPGIFRSWQASGSLTLSLRQKLAASLNMNCLKLAELFKHVQTHQSTPHSWFHLVQASSTLFNLIEPSDGTEARNGAQLKCVASCTFERAQGN